jgi:hypothetical protein
VSDRLADRDTARRSSGPTGENPMDARAIVETFLRSLEARDLEAAAAFLAPEVRMTFPGANVFARLEDVVAWSRGRYRSARKTFRSFDELRLDPDRTIVYCRGVLSGEWMDGRPFQNVRFIGRFELRGGRIVDQEVWNDLAEELRGD